MQNVPLQAIPNQEFSIQIDDNLFEFTIKYTNGVMSFTITVNGTLVIQNTRAVAGMRIIPSKYEEAGNFFFISNSEDLPNYTQFGITQALFYVSPAELALIRAPLPAPITASDFSPLGGLPLRFKPQGY